MSGEWHKGTPIPGVLRTVKQTPEGKGLAEIAVHAQMARRLMRVQKKGRRRNEWRAGRVGAKGVALEPWGMVAEKLITVKV